MPEIISILYFAYLYHCVNLYYFEVSFRLNKYILSTIQLESPTLHRTVIACEGPKVCPIRIKEQHSLETFRGDLLKKKPLECYKQFYWYNQLDNKVCHKLSYFILRLFMSLCESLDELRCLYCVGHVDLTSKQTFLNLINLCFEKMLLNIILLPLGASRNYNITNSTNFCAFFCIFFFCIIIIIFFFFFFWRVQNKGEWAKIPKMNQCRGQ